MESGGAASRTAVLVCQGRAVADERAMVNRFSDPIAARLLRDDERTSVDRAAADVPPQGWRARMDYELLNATAEIMIPRTIAIDDAIREHATPQVVILGAGLDSRAWRMHELGTATVWEVDHPATQQDKRDRVAELPVVAKQLHFLPVDFTRDALDAALASGGHLAETPTTWVWEGVVPYLSVEEVAATLRAVAMRSAAGSRLVVNYQAPSKSAVLGKLVLRAFSIVSRRADPLAEEPTRSTWSPEDLRALLAEHGFSLWRDDSLLDVAAALGLAVRHRRSLADGRVAIADR